MSNGKGSSVCLSGEDSTPSQRELAIDQGIGQIVELWIKGGMDEATAIMKTVAEYHEMTDEEFEEKYV